MGDLHAIGEKGEANLKEAVNWWRLAADKGHPNSQYNLGMMYLYGDGGLEQNFAEAKQWWEKAASQGHPRAQMRLKKYR